MLSITTNAAIREYLGLPAPRAIYRVHKVDMLTSNENTLMFINKSGVCLEELDDICSGCTFLIGKSYHEVDSTDNDFIRVDNPKFCFCLLVKKFELHSKIQNLHSSNILSQMDLMRKYPTLTCYEAIIGDNCQFDPGTIIGGTDFSPVMANDRSELVQFPQMGGVMIGNNVVVKYNSMIGKGTFGYTQIGDNTMIDFGCQIGHNCIIGKSCIIAAGTIIGGSTIVGDNTTIGIGAKIRNGIKIGQNVSVGMGSVVIRDIPDNCVVVGNPARIIEHKTIFDEEGLV